MAERSKAAVLKTVAAAMSPRVRIPVSPPILGLNIFLKISRRVAICPPLGVRIPVSPPFSNFLKQQAVCYFLLNLVK